MRKLLLLILLSAATASAQTYRGTVIGTNSQFYGWTSNVIYIDNILGSPANTGFEKSTPIDSITTLLTRNYFGYRLEFAGTWGTTYFVPLSQPLILSNNYIDLHGVTISGNGNDNPPDTTTNGIIVMNGPATVRNGTITAIASNIVQWPVIFNTGVNPTNCEWRVENCSLLGVSDTCGMNGGQGSDSMRFFLHMNNNFCRSWWDGPTFNWTATGDQTNSQINMVGNNVYLNYAEVPPQFTNLATGSILHGIFVNSGQFNLSGGSVKVYSGPLYGTNLYGIYINSTATRTLTNYLSGTTMVDVQTNANSATGEYLHDQTTSNIRLFGHPYPDNFIHLGIAGKITYVGAGSTNVPSGGLHTLGENLPWTNDLPGLADMVLSGFVPVPYGSGNTNNFAYSNSVTGECYTNSSGYANTFVGFYVVFPNINPGDFGVLSNFGNNQSLTNFKGIWKLHYQ